MPSSAEQTGCGFVYLEHAVVKHDTAGGGEIFRIRSVFHRKKLDKGVSFYRFSCASVAPFCFCHGGIEVSKAVVYRLLERRPDHEESFPINPSEHDVEEHIGFPTSAGAN